LSELQGSASAERPRENGTTEIEFEFEFDAPVSFVPGYLPLRGAGDLIPDAILEAATAAFTSRLG
jgi:hypothetical protein